MVQPLVNQRVGDMGGRGNTDKDRAEYNESQELENLQRVFQILSHQKPGTLTEKEQPKVTPDKLADALKKLAYKVKRTDVELSLIHI